VAGMVVVPRVGIVSDGGGSFGRMPGVVRSPPSRRRCASR